MTPRGSAFLLGLFLVGCTNGSSTTTDAGANGKDSATADTAADVPSTVCPGHVDYFPGGGGLTIRTGDGAPTISSLQISPELCRNFTNDLPRTDAGAGVAQVFIQASFTLAMPNEAISAECAIEVTSIHGERIQLTSTVSHNPHSMQMCPMNDNCCDPSCVKWLSSTSFYPRDQIVTFKTAPDASAPVDSPSDKDAVLD